MLREFIKGVSEFIEKSIACNKFDRIIQSFGTLL